MLAYFFFNDAITTAIAVMAVYAKSVMGFTTGQFILLYLVSTIFSIAGSFAFGYIARHLGAKKAVTLVAALLIVAITIAALAQSQSVFWVAGGLYGIAMGATWVTSRTLIVELTPEEKRGQFFGLYALSGKVSAIVGNTLHWHHHLSFGGNRQSCQPHRAGFFACPCRHRIVHPYACPLYE